jgi:hypothetical protein
MMDNLNMKWWFCLMTRIQAYVEGRTIEYKVQHDGRVERPAPPPILRMSMDQIAQATSSVSQIFVASKSVATPNLKVVTGSARHRVPLPQGVSTTIHLN